MRSSVWFWSLVSGLVVLGLLGWHMAVMHLHGSLGLFVSMSAEPLAWPDVVARGRSAVVAASYVLLLGAALFHGFYGLRTMLTEYWPTRAAQKLITISCWVTGGALFTVGAYAAIAFRSAALAP